MPLNIFLTIGKYLPAAATATIAVYKASDDSAVTLTSAACTEQETDVFYWSTSNITTQPTARTEYYYTITPNTGSAKQGRFTLLTYADVLMVERMIRSDRNNIRVGIVSILQSNTQYDIGHDDLSEFMREADAYIDAKLKRVYSVPLALTDIGTKRLIQNIATLISAYYIHRSMFPNATKDDMSVVVKSWFDSADKLLDDIIKGAIGLTGETLATGSPLSNYPVYGRPDVLFDKVGVATTTGEISDDDVGTN